MEPLVARNGMIYTDGKNTNGKVIRLGEGVDKSAFYEITQEEYDRILSEEMHEETGKDELELIWEEMAEAYKEGVQSA